MAVYFHQTPPAFYLPDIHAQIPDGAVAITAAEHQALLAGQSAGKIIVAGQGGRPVLENARPPAADLLVAERASMRVSRFQARAALHQAGLLAQIEAIVAASDTMTQIAWADAQEWQRNSPTLALLAVEAGLSATEIDDLFRMARLIVA